ncbi:uncharacterized protein LOC134838981 [Symsagittifera roscoffensis]|uniref:uncharacterized protein LOC134838981 n=1 Tax=Symsagittifera roscoffensis TaxID=84072 RepID=UPI00307C1CF4
MLNTQFFVLTVFIVNALQQQYLPLERINVKIGQIKSISKSSLLVSWTLNAPESLFSNIVGFELQYDDKPFFDNSSVREALYDSSTRSRVVSNLVGDTVYVFRVRPILSVPGNGATWSNVVAAETKGPDAKLALVMTFGMEVQAMKQELLINLIVEVVKSALEPDLRVQSVQVQDIKNVLASSIPSLDSPPVVKAYIEVIYKSGINFTFHNRH